MKTNRNLLTPTGFWLGSIALSIILGFAIVGIMGQMGCRVPGPSCEPGFVHNEQGECVAIDPNCEDDVGRKETRSFTLVDQCSGIVFNAPEGERIRVWIAHADGALKEIQPNGTLFETEVHSCFLYKVRWQYKTCADLTEDETLTFPAEAIPNGDYPVYPTTGCACP